MADGGMGSDRDACAGGVSLEQWLSSQRTGGSFNVSYQQALFSNGPVNDSPDGEVATSVFKGKGHGMHFAVGKGYGKQMFPTAGKAKGGPSGRLATWR